MTTALSDIESVNKAMQERCDGYIVKPVRGEVLRSKLRSLGLIGLKVLIAEDDSTSRLLLQRLLEPYGEVHTTANGRDAITVFRLAMTQRKPYDLVCLDIMMPEANGHEALVRIRGMESKQNRAKIIMTTTLANVENVEKAVQERCDAYIVKPIRKEMLIDKLHSLGLL